MNRLFTFAALAAGPMLLAATPAAFAQDDSAEDEAIEEALRQGCHVNVVEKKEARAGLDGLAALLRVTGA